jgi:hypothetical protein
VCVFAFATYSAAAQDFGQLKKMAEEDAVKAQLTATFNKLQIIGMEGGVMSNIKGAPYSGEQVTENTQTLGDGTRIHNENSVKLYRDAEGRVRRETPDMISIFDPVTGVGYTLNPKTMTGGKMQIAVSIKPGSNTFSYAGTAPPGGDDKEFRIFTGNGSVNGSMATATAGGRGTSVSSGVSIGGAGGIEPSVVYTTSSRNFAFTKSISSGKLETLPAQTMEGLNVQGQRRSQTIEIGEIGNDRPIETVDERWYSPDLKLEVMTRHNDPRTGEQITRLVNIVRGDPDPGLFQLPAGYQINEGKQFPVSLPVFVPRGVKMTPLIGKDQ